MASVQKTQKFDYETVHEIFKKFSPDIRKQINTKNIIPAMRKKLSDADLQPMECLYKNEGQIRAADELMEAVKRKPNSFVQFICTVHKEGHLDIVDKIRDYLWKKHKPQLIYLDEKLKKKGLHIKSKNVMVVEPLGSQAPCDTSYPVLPPVVAHPLQLYIGQGQSQFGQEPAAFGTVHQQPVYSPTVQLHAVIGTVHQQPVYSPTVQSQAAIGTVHQQPIYSSTIQSREVPKLPADVQPNLIHLPGTTNVHHSTDTGIVVTEIPYNLFSQLSEELCKGDPSNWTKLAKAFPFLKRIDVSKIEKKKNPGEALLDMLGDKGCTLQQIGKALESAGLQNELDILQEHYGNFVGGQQGYVSSANIQEPVNSQQEPYIVLNQSQSSFGQSFSEQSQNMDYKQTLERIDENNLNIAIDQSIKREVGTKNLNIPGDARTDINKELDTLNLSDSQTCIVPQAVLNPQQDVPMDDSQVAHSQVSLNENAEEMLMGDNQRSQRDLFH
ncbi:hypothetical protein CHS0354_019850 [Potamilus streckersoni]|uniref:Caspase recruitment domain-containing protein n=1 Tax=Potamilus streckersoni TaxID=2493646 RepID=A0AAE0VNG5_9BIVA|nr:hypothetical protein CHS0354_019850 [Potamilus streckersoni]